MGTNHYFDSYSKDIKLFNFYNSIKGELHQNWAMSIIVCYLKLSLFDLKLFEKLKNGTNILVGKAILEL